MRIICLLFAVVLAAAAPATPSTSKIDMQLERLIGTKPGQTRSLQFALVRNGAIVDDRSLGGATSQTRFPIGSITKMFTAVSIMQLVQRGRIALAAHVSRYLPDAPYASRITIEQLLTHTSGLWNYGDMAFARGWVTKPTTPAEILAMVARHPLDFPPGSKWSYSNSGYVVLGQIVEAVSKEPLAVYERQHIFAIAGMRDTTSHIPRRAAVAAGYMSAGGTKAPAYHDSWLYACGNILSTAGDIARFDIALMDGKLVSPATLTLMQMPRMTTQFGEQGLGVFLSHAMDYSLVGHHGGLPGYEADNEFDPHKRFAMVVLSNTFNFATGDAERVALLGALPPAVASAADLRVAAEFRTALESLLDGKVDRSRYTPEAAFALTPALVQATAVQLAPLGTISSVTFRRKTPGTDGGAMYYFDVRFSSGRAMLWQFGLTPKGLISAIGSSG